MKRQTNLHSDTHRNPGTIPWPAATVSTRNPVVVLALLMIVLGTAEFLMVLAGFLATRFVRPSKSSCGLLNSGRKSP